MNNMHVRGINVMAQHFPIVGAARLTACAAPYLNKDVLSIIHEYTSLYFDLPFLRDSLKFFDMMGVFATIDETKVRLFEINNHHFQGYQLERKEGNLFSLLRTHIITDASAIVVKGREGSVVVKNDKRKYRVHDIFNALAILVVRPGRRRSDLLDIEICNFKYNVTLDTLTLKVKIKPR